MQNAVLYLIAVITLSFSSLAQEPSNPDTPGQTRPGGSMEHMPGMSAAPHATTSTQPKSLIELIGAARDVGNRRGA